MAPGRCNVAQFRKETVPRQKAGHEGSDVYLNKIKIFDICILA
jgi:hypothetical protein